MQEDEPCMALLSVSVYSYIRGRRKAWHRKFSVMQYSIVFGLKFLFVKPSIRPTHGQMIGMFVKKIGKWDLKNSFYILNKW